MKKAKISWGTGITIAIAGFIGFIMYFVITMMTDEAYSHDLVTEEYYKKELDFEQQLQKEQNAGLLIKNLEIKQTGEGLLITFPEEMDPNNITGTVFLYRPSNKQLDREIPLSLSSHQLLVPDKSLIGGRWNINIDWNYGGKGYYFKKEILY